MSAVDEAFAESSGNSSVPPLLCVKAAKSSPNLQVTSHLYFAARNALPFSALNWSWSFLGPYLGKPLKRSSVGWLEWILSVKALGGRTPLRANLFEKGLEPACYAMRLITNDDPGSGQAEFQHS